MRMPANKAHFLELAGLPRLAGRGLVALYRVYAVAPYRSALQAFADLLGICR